MPASPVVMRRLCRECAGADGIVYSQRNLFILQLTGLITARHFENKELKNLKYYYLEENISTAMPTLTLGI